MKYTDQIKAKAEEFDLSGKFDDLSAKAKKGLSDAKVKAEAVAADSKDKAIKGLSDAKSKAGAVAHDSKDKVEGLLDKAGSAIDDKTDGKYAETVAKVKTKTSELVDKVASNRPDAETPPETSKSPDA
jgi:hypothetical protein